MDAEMKIDDEDVLLPGFRFHPTDEELVGFYLKRKVQHQPIPADLIKLLDIYKYDPWDLPKVSPLGEKESYFYCPRDRKYKNSARPNRVTQSGFWKATGTNRPIFSSAIKSCIGFKKSLVFYAGRAAKCTKTDWMMHEFLLPDVTKKDSLALCRVFKKAANIANKALSFQNETLSVLDHFSLPSSDGHCFSAAGEASGGMGSSRTHLSSSSLFINPCSESGLISFENQQLLLDGFNSGVSSQFMQEIIDFDDDKQSMEKYSWDLPSDLWDSPPCS